MRANIGDLRRTEDGAVLQVRGKGDKDRRIPVEAVLVHVLEHYLDSRKPASPTPRAAPPPPGTSRLAGVSAAVVGGDGQRITRGTLQYRVLRVFKKAGIDAERARGALVHGLRHTFATELDMRGIASDALFDSRGERCGSDDLGLRPVRRRRSGCHLTRLVSCVDARPPSARMHWVQR